MKINIIKVIAKATRTRMGTNTRNILITLPCGKRFPIRFKLLNDDLQSTMYKHHTIYET